VNFPESERLRLREFDLTDFAALQEFVSRPDVCRWPGSTGSRQAIYVAALSAELIQVDVEAHGQQTLGPAPECESLALMTA